jgi:hypothetical protein
MNFSNSNSSLKEWMKRAEEENVMVRHRPRRFEWLRPGIGRTGRRLLRPSRGGGGGGHRGGGGFGGGRGRRFGGRGSGGGSGSRPDRPDEGLPKIAAATGGGYFELTSTDDLASTFTRVADEPPSSMRPRLHAHDAGRQDAHTAGADCKRRPDRARSQELSGHHPAFVMVANVPRAFPPASPCPPW